MTSDQREWSRTKDELLDAVTALGFPKELGDAMAKNLGSPKAMRSPLPLFTSFPLSDTNW